jgi:ribosomal protein L24E
MAPLIENVRSVMVARQRAERPMCFACGRTIAPGEQRLRVRGGSVVHRACATYEKRNPRS